MIKKSISLALATIFLITGCSDQVPVSGNASDPAVISDDSIVDDQIIENPSIEENEIPVSEIDDLTLLPIAEGEDADTSDYRYEPSFDNLDSSGLKRYMIDTLYDGVVTELQDSDYYISDMDSVYISQEYIDELAYNSRSNIFFGYTLEELDASFVGTRYIFTLGDQGDTIVTAVDGYDKSYERAIRNVADGTGVILIALNACDKTDKSKTVSMVFAVSAVTGTALAVSAAALSAVISATIVGISTGNMDKAKEAAISIGSEAFKWGAIVGTVAGAAIGTYSVFNNVGFMLTPDQISMIQKGLKLPIKAIHQICESGECEALLDADLIPQLINGATALIKSNIELDTLDELGRTNLQRMQLGLAPYDASGEEYELHQIGQGEDGTIVVLTHEEAMNPSLENLTELAEVGLSDYSSIKKMFWKSLANLLIEKVF